MKSILYGIYTYKKGNSNDKYDYVFLAKNENEAKDKFYKFINNDPSIEIYGIYPILSDHCIVSYISDKTIIDWSSHRYTVITGIGNNDISCIRVENIMGKNYIDFSPYYCHSEINDFQNTSILSLMINEEGNPDWIKEEQ